MLQWWADYLDANRVKGVSPFDFGKRIMGEMRIYSKGHSRLDLLFISSYI